MNDALNDTQIPVVNLTRSRQDLVEQGEYDVMIYAAIVLSIPLLLLAQVGLLVAFCAAASTNLHDHMLNYVMQAPMRFFDTTPVGKKTILKGTCKVISVNNVIPS